MTTPVHAASPARGWAPAPRQAELAVTRRTERVLDVPFDRLARLAVRVLGAPMAFVTIVDEQPSLWRSWIGTGAGADGVHQPSLAVEICRRVVASGGVMVVSDAVSDPRTRDDHELIALGACAWAGFPLEGAGGAVLGTLCVLDDVARRWSVEDLEVIATLADAAACEVGLRDAVGRADETAEVLQRSMLTDLPDVRHVQLAASYRPARETAQVGGDWYDAFQLPDGVTALVVGDVSGHDLAAAARMGQLRNLVRGIACYANPAPHELLSGLDTVAFGLGVADLATAIYARVEPADDGGWLLRWANAGHPPPLLVLADGTARYLDQPSGLLLGLGVGEHLDGVACLPPLSTLILYTDGLVESRDTPLDLGLDRLLAAAADCAGTPLDELCAGLVRALVGQSNEDDVTLLVLRVPL